MSMKEFRGSSLNQIISKDPPGDNEEIQPAQPKRGGGTKETKESRRVNYTVEIYFSSHGTAEDIKGVEKNTPQAGLEKFKRRGLLESFQRADIYVPELHGWNEFSLSRMQELSYGRVTPEQIIKEIKLKPEHPMFGFLKSEMEMIYGSYKPIIIFDVPDTHPRSKVLRDYMLGQTREKIKGRPTFEKILAIIKKDLREKADLHNEREDYMLNQLASKLEEVFKQRPDLVNKPDLRVLMFLGAYHTRVVQMLTKYGVKVQSRHSRSPQIFGFENEAQRSLALGKEVSNELASKVLLEGLCSSLMGPIASSLTEDSNEAEAFIRRIVSLFTYEEIKNLYEMGIPRAVGEFFVYLEKKGVNPPSSHTELVSFISDFKTKN